MSQETNSPRSNTLPYRSGIGPVNNGIYIFYITVIGLIILTSTAGNIIVFAAVLKSKNIVHLPTFYLVLNLAFADLSLATVVMPLSVIIMLSYWDFLILSTTLCLIWQSLLFFFISLSLLTLSAISVERCLAVTSAYVYRRRVRSRWIIAAIVIIWCLSIGLAVKPIIDLIQFHGKPMASDHTSNLFKTTPSIGLSYAMQHDNSSYAANVLTHNPAAVEIKKSCIYYNAYSTWTILAFILLATYLIVPFIIMIACNARIYHAARQHFKMRREMLRMYTATIAIPNNRERGRESKRFLRELRAAKTLGVVVGIAILCFTPFTIITFILQVCPGSCLTYQKGLQWLGVVLTYVNSACNPIIYGWSSREFRFAFKYLFKQIDPNARHNSCDSSSAYIHLSNIHPISHIPLSMTPVQLNDSRRGSQTSLTFSRGHTISSPQISSKNKVEKHEF
ncbi:uncharacterized protein TRIADDRAFT_58713 [Trichoplax adhaerens]|uniref:G-protein coupled receptors family 1 profile domain-containing protein n=1 Tax=Trichoplax adhaerens TaxID=10228 RepID=B3S3G5_TRIAD|nr:hypothetical protein TRIADDRAFT_58713 [Trichoplax adhaerens]EDV22965.1 hypothetical protein TRIADDRAFT_58713 [Trichoplax adhaerens]|eukprot:XP_002114831.1 hypothetical protein TRIADDRAFT_58713 [Trichoplax adhaerens]